MSPSDALEQVPDSVADPEHRLRPARRQGPGGEVPADRPLRPPEGAPNVLIIFIDDVGFARSSAFGGPCHADGGAARRRGLKFNRFHTTALCSPTRRRCSRAEPPHCRHGRHHRDRDVRARIQLDPPEHVRPTRRDAEAQRLLDRAVRQMPRGPVWETSPMGPFDGGRPDRASTTSTASSAGRRTSTPPRSTGHVPVEPDQTPEEGYHFTEDMTDQAIDWVRQQKALMPDKPFFVYFAPGATTPRITCRPEWSDKYKGKFDHGWDALRERTFDARSS